MCRIIRLKILSFLLFISLLFNCTDGLEIANVELDSLYLSPKIAVPLGKTEIRIDSIIQRLGQTDDSYRVNRDPQGALFIQKNQAINTSQIQMSNYLNTARSENTIEMTSPHYSIIVRDLIPMGTEDASGNKLESGLFSESNSNTNPVYYGVDPGTQPNAGFFPDPANSEQPEKTLNFNDRQYHTLNDRSKASNLASITSSLNDIYLTVTNGSLLTIKKLRVSLDLGGGVSSKVTFENIEPTNGTISEDGGDSKIPKSFIASGLNAPKLKFSNTNNPITVTTQLKYQIEYIEIEPVGVVDNGNPNTPMKKVLPEESLMFQFEYEFKQISSVKMKNAPAVEYAPESYISQGSWTNPAYLADKSPITYQARIASGHAQITVSKIDFDQLGIKSLDISLESIVRTQQSSLGAQQKVVLPITNWPQNDFDPRVISIDLAGMTMEMSNGSRGDIFNYGYSVVLNSPTGISIDDAKKLKVEIEFKDIKTTSIKGIFGEFKATSTIEPFGIGSLSEDEAFATQVNLKDASVALEYSNTLGVPTKIASKLFAEIKNNAGDFVKGKEANILETEIEYRDNNAQGSSAENPIPAVGTDIEYNNSGDLLSPIPNRFKGSLDIIVGEEGIIRDEPTEVVTFNERTKLDISAKIVMPMNMSINRLTMKDTIYVNSNGVNLKEEITASLKNQNGGFIYGYIVVELLNQSPLIVSQIDLNLLNQNLSNIRTLTPTNEDGTVTKFSNGTITSGKVSSPVKSFGRIEITEALLDDLAETQRVEVEIETTTEGIDAGVQLYATDKITIGIDFNISPYRDNVIRN